MTISIPGSYTIRLLFVGISKNCRLCRPPPTSLMHLKDKIKCGVYSTY